MLKKIKNKIIKEIILTLLKVKIFKNKFFNKIFTQLLNFSGENMYYLKQKDKEMILNRIRDIKNANNNISFNLDDDLIKISREIKETGICSDLSVNVNEDDVKEVVDYFEKKHFYDSHTPHKENKKNFGDKPSGAYISYDNNTQLNCTPLLKLCLNDQIIKIAYSYLGCMPRLFSLNTFKTFPNQKAFTHGFHRDLDDFLWLTVFVYWTDTFENDGAFEQIKYTHCENKELQQIRNQKFNGINYDKFYNDTMGYTDKSYDEFTRLFGKKNILRVYGKRGKVVAADTAGLHRGTSVKNNRLVTWIRYGVTGSRQKNYSYEKKVDLNSRNKIIFNQSKFKNVLEDIL